MDIQRTILLIIFGMSLVFLWDGWQKHHGRSGGRHAARDR